MTTAASDVAATPRRRRRWLRHTGIVGAILVALAAAIVLWLLYTVNGRDTLLRRVVALLPPGSLTWQRAEGVLSGQLVLYDVHYRHAGVDFRARRVALESALRPLFDKRLQLVSLDIDHVFLDLPVDRTPQPLPSWPGSLPKFAVPFPFTVDRMRVRELRISREGTPLVQIASADGGFELAPGLLALRDVAVTSDRGTMHADGRMDARRSYLTRIKASLVLPGTAARSGSDVRMQAGGDLDHFVLAVHGHMPAAFAVTLTLDNGRVVPRWALAVQAPSLDPGLLQPLPARAAGEPAIAAVQPYSVTLQVTGLGGRAAVQGRIAQGDRAIAIAPSQLSYAQGVFAAQPLALELLDGSVAVRGHLDVRPASPMFDGNLDVHGLRWSAAASAPPVAADGKLALQGTFDAWKIAGTLGLLREGRRADVTLSGSGDRTGMRFEHLDARTPAGTMATHGQVTWSPLRTWSLDGTLARFDPGFFAPGFEGAVSGHIATHGGIDADDVLSVHADADDLSGSLRGRRLGGHGTLDWKAGLGRADIDLRIGASHVEASGAFGRTLELVARFEPLRLDDLLPDAHGTLQGKITLQGNPKSPGIEGHLEGTGLHWNGRGAAHVLLDGRLKPDAEGTLRLDAQGVEGIAGVSSLQLRVAGSQRSPRVEGEIVGAYGTVALAGGAEQRGSAWVGNLTRLHYTPVHGAAWSLSAPTAFRYEQTRALHLQHACMASGGASVCADADWPRSANVQAHALPLALLDPWIARPDMDVRTYGTVDFDARISPGAKGALNGSAHLHSAEGGLHLQQQLARPLLGYTQLSGAATLDDGHLQLRLDSALVAGGSVHATATTGLAPDAPLSGSIDVQLHDITWLELFSTDIAAPKGQLDGRIALGGSRNHPSLSGHATLDDLQAELPSLGIAITQGHIALDADPGGDARVSGSLRSGDGTLAIGGALRWNTPGAPVSVTLKGKDVRLADTPELRAVASPDLQLGFAAGTLTVRGTVDVTRAKLDLERLDSVVSPSPDVVVLDPAEKEARSALAVDVDIALTLGSDVELKGFGLDGKLAGQLRVRRTPGSPMTAVGLLDVSGRYAAYGQQLEIVRGRLGYGGGGFDNPTLDILAQRTFDEATVGVRVRGTALRPQTQVVSTPAMDPSNALAYLVIGRPLNTASADEGRQIGAASAALSVGGNLVAQKIGARLGLDTAGIGESRALGGTTFTVGKYLSPRLLVSYGVSLVGTGEVLTLKYLLRKGFDVQVESGRENRASINWRIEK